MKRKPVPEPPASVAGVAEAQDALPLVPASEEDAVQRLLQRGVAQNREDAGEWLQFLLALGLAREAGAGYVRVRTAPEDVDLPNRFLDGVFGAERLLEMLETEGPLDAPTAYERFREEIPQWERNKRQDWEGVWRERVRRLLDWAVLFDLATVDGDGYRPA